MNMRTMATIKRPNQKDLSDPEWDDFIEAINSMHGTGARTPAYREFVSLHVDAMDMGGILYAFEKRLGIPLPYWNWIDDPEIPSRLNDRRLLRRWSITRRWDQEEMPTDDQVESQVRPKIFPVFQRSLELGAHAAVHIAIGGTMNSSSSPADPIFFLHHANLDRIWAEWQKKNPRSNPSNRNDILQRRPIMGVKVSSVLNISSLGYSYE
jgi:hypothetical protein